MRLVEKGGPADAHDAGPSAAGGKKEAQLMLMMLGPGAAEGKKEAQLMLMMLVPVRRLVGKRRLS